MHPLLRTFSEHRSFRMTEYFVSQIVTPTTGGAALMERAQFLAAWPAGTDLA